MNPSFNFAYICSLRRRTLWKYNAICFAMFFQKKIHFRLELNVTYLSPWIKNRTWCISYHSIHAANTYINHNKHKHVEL